MVLINSIKFEDQSIDVILWTFVLTLLIIIASFVYEFINRAKTYGNSWLKYRIKYPVLQKFTIPPDGYVYTRLRTESIQMAMVAGSKRMVKKLYRLAGGRSVANKTRKRIHWQLCTELVPKSCLPLVCFVNCKSGGNQGRVIRDQFLKYLNPIQVVDLSHTDPVVVIEEFSKLLKWMILVCGGDGTVGWILDSLDTVYCHKDSKCLPSVAILPIGTGNDLSIELGWGSSYSNTLLNEENTLQLMYDLLRAEPNWLDRWTTTTLQPTTSDSITSIKKKTFQNYCGIGVDAQIVLQFHTLRNANPHRFFHRWMNKIWYGVMGWNEIWGRNCSNFSKYVKLYEIKEELNHPEIVIRNEILIPDDCEGIVFLNISSYGGGSKLWFDAEELEDDEDTQLFHNQSLSDGELEVVAVQNSLQLARVKMGMANCQKLFQGKQFEIHIHIHIHDRRLPIQWDGEPELQPYDCKFRIACNEHKVRMLRCRKKMDCASKLLIDVLKLGGRK